MSKRARILFLLVALAVSLGASFLVLSRLSEPAKPAPAVGPELTRVVVAKVNVAAGKMLDASDLATMKWPKGATPSGAVADPATLVGRAVKTDIFAGEPVTEMRLMPKGTTGGIAVVIPEGMRAVSVRVDEVVGVGGFVQPGSHVDVLATVGARGETSLTYTVLQNVELLAADQRTEAGREGEPKAFSVATLLLTPAEAERLVFAANQGRIHLTLRNPLDADSASTRGANLSALQPSRPQTVRRAPPPITVEAIRGTERTVIKH